MQTSLIKQTPKEHEVERELVDNENRFNVGCLSIEHNTNTLCVFLNHPKCS